VYYDPRLQPHRKFIILFWNVKCYVSASVHIFAIAPVWCLVYVCLRPSVVSSPSRPDDTEDQLLATRHAWRCTQTDCNWKYNQDLSTSAAVRLSGRNHPASMFILQSAAHVQITVTRGLSGHGIFRLPARSDLTTYYKSPTYVHSPPFRLPQIDDLRPERGLCANSGVSYRCATGPVYVSTPATKHTSVYLLVLWRRVSSCRVTTQRGGSYGRP